MVALLTAGSMMLFSNVAFASILGQETSHYETEYAQGTTYNKNTFMSESVGQQTENFFEYVPNADVIPIISNGEQVFGKRTVSEANEYLNEQGIFAAMGMNADFFSFQTGVPMSNTITDGYILTADTELLTGIGFNADGTAFISPMQIAINLKTDTGASFDIECLNKYRQPYVLYMYTDEFGSYTNASGMGTNVVLGSVNGKFEIGKTVTAVVEDIYVDDGSVEIPDGKLVISVDSSAPWDVRTRLDNLSIGQKVSITATETTGDMRWLSANYGMGCLGGTLIRNGELDYEDESAAPRSAVGIKSDGSMIFYTIDGRQQGYSYGVRKETLARRLLELGCVDAINLDGGGSTQIGGTLPETTEFQILNSPSESLRKCANFIFLKKLNAPDGIPYKLFVYPYGEYVLSGTTVGVWASAIDKSYGKATMTELLSFVIDKNTTADVRTNIDSDGYLTVYGDGDVYVSATSGNASGSTLVHSVLSPENITAYNENDGSEINTLSIAPNESINLTADSYFSGVNLTDVDTAYTWSLSDERLGTITNDGIFTASGNLTEGSIIVSAGLTKKEIPVTVIGDIVSGDNNVSSDTNYPVVIAVMDTDDGFKAKLYGTKGDINQDSITLKSDGKKVAFSYDEENNIIEYKREHGYDGGVHLMSIYATDSNGTGGIKTSVVGDISTINNIYEDTENHWARDYISYMSKRGVVSGYDEGDFRPDRNMTRAEFACMIAKYLNINVYNYRGVTLPYADAESIPEWAYMQVQALYSLGIMQGTQDGDKIYFSPYQNIRRSEYCVAAARLLPSNLYSSGIDVADKDDIPAWAKDSMALLYTHGIIGGYTDGEVKPYNNVTRAEAVKILFGLGQ